MKKLFKITLIVIAAVSTALSVRIAIDYCFKKYRKTYIKV